ncbi:hypothetical protein [Lentibacillus amyloliquefaciens]|uniref:Uncharacterized protein n=1 Tax=Lentibacillus amyloliquefaciens TaxID=1472767 RepID=A0A0U4EVD6_9BACI|nr:hypothetical protein [Lentibacillus amyloliquefaciens]ALX47319.1 hypothetical protein AOX59_01115 [Lentibacillus amyloliquefaciens]
MTVEMENFLYELKKQAMQTHTLKDAYESLTPGEQEKISSLAPSTQAMPTEQAKVLFEWYEKMQDEYGVKDDE